MRLAAAAITAVASLLLITGCGATTTADKSPSAVPAANLCKAQLSSGAASSAVKVSGAFGAPATASFTAPLNVDSQQVSVVTKGSGKPVSSGDFISYALTAFDAKTGKKLGDLGYKPGETMPQQISADTPLAQIFGCGAPGTRTVMTFPATSETGTAQVDVFDLLGVVPTAAWGTPEQAPAGMPTVTLAKGGAPTVTIPKGQSAPSRTTVSVLKKGDGYQVQSGDQVLIQYTGVRWSNGKTFDTTWKKGGVPLSGAVSNFVPGFQKALEGQTVGSQVLAVITPTDGYGAGTINTKDLTGETLVFVIDILGAQTSSAQ